MSDLSKARACWADYDNDGGTVANDRSEGRRAALHDRRDLVRVGGRLYDETELPHPADVWEAGDEL